MFTRKYLLPEKIQLFLELYTPLDYGIGLKSLSYSRMQPTLLLYNESSIFSICEKVLEWELLQVCSRSF